MRTGRLREAEGPPQPHIQEGQMTEQLFARSLEVPAAGAQQAVTWSHLQKRRAEAPAPGVLPAWGPARIQVQSWPRSLGHGLWAYPQSWDRGPGISR